MEDSKKLFNSLKSDLCISTLDSCGTYVVLVATSPVKEANQPVRLSCKNFVPLGGLVYDTQSDSYLINCFDLFHIGTLPMALVATVRNCPNWSSNLPLTERMIKKLLSTKQKKEVKKFISIFNKDFIFYYVQMLDPNYGN